MADVGDAPPRKSGRGQLPKHSSFAVARQPEARAQAPIWRKQRTKQAKYGSNYEAVCRRETHPFLHVGQVPYRCDREGYDYPSRDFEQRPQMCLPFAEVHAEKIPQNDDHQRQRRKDRETDLQEQARRGKDRNQRDRYKEGVPVGTQRQVDCRRDRGGHGKLHENIMNKFFKVRYPSKKEKISVRSKHKPSEIAKRLYHNIRYYTKDLVKNREHRAEQHRMYLYCLVMCSFRVRELSKLEKEHCDIERKRFISPKTITKTKIIDEKPIPDEVLEFVKNAPSGKLFTEISGSTIDRAFARLVKLAEIETIYHYRITPHDCRNLMVTIMASPQHLQLD